MQREFGNLQNLPFDISRSIIHNHRIPKEDSNYVPLLSSNALTQWSLISRAQLLLKKERHRGRQRLRNSTRGGGAAHYVAAAATRRTRRARTITCFSSKPTIAEVAGLKAVVPFPRGLLHFMCEISTSLAQLQGSLLDSKEKSLDPFCTLQHTYTTHKI